MAVAALVCCLGDGKTTKRLEGRGVYDQSSGSSKASWDRDPRQLDFSASSVMTAYFLKIHMSWRVAIGQPSP